MGARTRPTRPGTFFDTIPFGICTHVHRLDEPADVTFRDDEHLQRAIRTFFGAEEPAAPMCHGASAPITVEPRVARA